MQGPKGLLDKECCNNFKIPTGIHGEQNDIIVKCIQIERDIQDANNAAILGVSSAEDDRYYLDDNSSAQDAPSNAEPEDDDIIFMPIQDGIVINSDNVNDGKAVLDYVGEAHTTSSYQPRSRGGF